MIYGLHDLDFYTNLVLFLITRRGGRSSQPVKDTIRTAVTTVVLHWSVCQSEFGNLLLMHTHIQLLRLQKPKHCGFMRSCLVS